MYWVHLDSFHTSLVMVLDPRLIFGYYEIGSYKLLPNHITSSPHWAYIHIMMILFLFIPKLGKVLVTIVNTGPRPRSTKLTLKNITRDAPLFWMEKFPPFIQSQWNVPMMEAWILLVWLITCKILGCELSCVWNRCFHNGCKFFYHY